MNDKVSLEEYLELLNKYEELRGNLIHRNNEYYVLKADHNKLQSNWNSLREWIEEEYAIVKSNSIEEPNNPIWCIKWNEREHVLDKMNELEKRNEK